MTQQIPYVGYFATTEVLLYPERFDFRSLRITPVILDGFPSIPAGNEAVADYFAVMVSEKPLKEEPTQKCLGDFANKFEAEIFRQRMVRILDTADDLAITAMCLWEALLHLRGSNNPDDVVQRAMDAVYKQHGTCEMRSAMNDLAEACDREYSLASANDQFDGSFDWEWCHNWLRERVNWDPTGEALPTLIPVP